MHRMSGKLTVKDVLFNLKSQLIEYYRKIKYNKSLNRIGAKNAPPG